jgi:hypothetical protein
MLLFHFFFIFTSMSTSELTVIRNKIRKSLESEDKVKQIEKIFKELVQKSHSGTVFTESAAIPELEALKTEAQAEVNVGRAVTIVEETTDENPIQGIDYSLGRITTFIQNTILTHQDFDIPTTRIFFLNTFGQLFDLISFDFLTIRFYFEKIKYGNEYEKEFNLEIQYKIDSSFLIESNDIKAKYAKVTLSMYQKLKILQDLLEELMSKTNDFLKSDGNKLSEYKIKEYVSPIDKKFKEFSGNLFNYN